MNFLRLVFLLMLAGSVARAESRPIDSFQRKSLLRDWKTARLGVYVDMGDHVTRGNTILPQRLDNGRAPHSVIGQGSAAGWRLPVLVDVVTDAHATKLVEQALDFYGTAQREEPTSESDGKPSHRLSMFLEFVTAFTPSKNNEYSYRANFDLGAETHKEFLRFIEGVAKAPKE